MKSLVFAILFVLPIFAYPAVYELQYGDYDVKISLNQNRLTGTYQSFYKNGNVRAEGEILNGYRKGKWLLYDSLGTVLCMRDYYELGKVKTEGETSGFNTKTNQQDFAPYDEFNTKEILFVKRLWSFIPIQNNKDLFVVKWSKILQKWKESSTIKLYTGSDELNQVADDAFLKKAFRFECDELRIKEDYFYDRSRKIAEYRIIALGFDFYIGQEQPETIWVYYPEIRPLLAKITSGGIENLEHLFFVRNFYSEWYKESNVNNKLLSEYEPRIDLIQARNRILTDLLESEHLCWLN